MSRDMSVISSCYAITASDWWGYSYLVIYMHIGVGSALLVSMSWAMRRPLGRETGNRYRFSRFFFLNNKEYTAESGELIGKGDEKLY